MIEAQQTSRDLSARLAEVEHQPQKPRRKVPADLTAMITNRCDVALVEGARRVDDPARRAYPNPTVGSSSQIADAVLWGLLHDLG